MESHNKTITSICVGKVRKASGEEFDQYRLISVSLDGYLILFSTKEEDQVVEKEAEVKKKSAKVKKSSGASKKSETSSDPESESKPKKLKKAGDPNKPKCPQTAFFLFI